MIKNHIPAFDWIASYKKADFRKDLLAGLIVAIMLIPQGMAYAMLAGLPPVVGLYAATIPAIIYAIFGTSRQLSVGPVALVSILVLASVSPLAEIGTKEYLSLVLLLMFLIGLTQFLLGIFRLGFLINFISHAVMSGFISAAAIIISFNQLKHLLGINIESNHVFHILLETINKSSEINNIVLIIGVVSILILLGIKKYSLKIPGPLIVVALGMLVVYFGQLQSYGVTIVGNIPKGLPSLSLPIFKLDSVIKLLPIALTISLIGFMESIAMSKFIASKKKYKINPNKELIGLGLANVVGSFFSAYPVTGSFSRSAVNYESEAKTQLSSIFTAVFILLTLLFFTSYFYYLPLTVLGAIIIVAVYSLIDIKEVKYLFSVKKIDGWTWVVTFIATLITRIEFGILIGIGFSLLVLMGRTINPNLVELGYVEDDNVYQDIKRYPEAKTNPEILIYRADTSLHFANMTFLEGKISDRMGENPEFKWIILDFSGVNFIDAVAIYTLEDIIETADNGNMNFLFVGIKGPVMDMFKKADWENKYQGQIEYLSIDQAIHTIENQK